jgi:alanyl-tRNA synthetase
MLRICSITNHDSEACGGIHADNTGEVGLITIIKVERPTDGTVRFIYKAGDVAKEFLGNRSKLLKESAELLGVDDKDAPKAAAKLLEDWKDKRKELEKKQEELAKKKLKSLKFEEAKGFKILIEHLPNTDMNQMKEISRTMTADNTVILLIGSKERTYVLGSCGPVSAKQGMNMGKIVEAVCKILEGRGGGSPELAQGFGSDARNIAKALEEAKRMVKHSG